MTTQTETTKEKQIPAFYIVSVWSWTPFRGLSKGIGCLSGRSIVST